VPYVSNEERIRLGLQHWGSDVPQDALDAALAAHHGACAVASAQPAAAEPEKPKRARTRRGQFQADDPNTAEVNEAFVEG